MAASYQGVRLINIYAPSGAEKRQEREEFFNAEIPYLLSDNPTTLIMGGDYNCILAKTDATGHFNFSRALNTLIAGYDLVDMWAPTTGRAVYTHYTRSGAARLDRIYVSRHLSGQKYGIETAVAAFTDHLAVILRIAFDVTTIQRGRSYWKMDAALVRDDGVQKTLHQRWSGWKRQRNLYPNIVVWWERVAKTQLRKLLITEGAMRRRDDLALGNFYHAALYELLQSPPPHEEKTAAINHIKAKIVRLYAERLRHGNIELQDTDVLQTERTTLYQLIRRRKRRAQCTITSVRDPADGMTKKTTKDIVNVFSTALRLKYSPIRVTDESIGKMEEAGFVRLSEEWRNALYGPLTSDELHTAITKGQTKKAPGRDGIGLSLFQDTWNTIKDDWLDLFSQMFVPGNLTEQQKRGVVVCIPKTTRPTQPSDYRPITLLNTDYKTLARLLANQMRPTLEELLHPSQFCGRPGSTIFEALATVREAVAVAEMMRKPLNILTLDFSDAFDRISHQYLFAILHSYGFSKSFVDRIRHMYTNASSVVQINGNLSAPFPIQCSVRQGCPLSMTLFTLCINPLIYLLEQELQGIRVNWRQRKTAVVAYADDVTILVTTPEEIAAIDAMLRRYEEATGAKLNIVKSHAMAVGTWDTKSTVMNIPYTTEVKILGIQIANKTEQSAVSSWSRISNMVRLQAREAYTRDLDLAQRIQYVHTYLLAKLWYTAQVLPAPSVQIRQIVSAVAWYIWQGISFGFPSPPWRKRRTREAGA